MAKYYRRTQQQRAQHASESRGVLRYFLMVMLIIFCFSTGYAVHLYKQQPARYTGVNTAFLDVKTWLTERNQRLHQGVQQVKKMTAQKTEEQPIHFEFYTTLPNMQVANAAPPSAPVVEKVKITSADSLEKDLFAEIEQIKKR